MKKHGTASKLESGQLAELASAIVRQLPHIEGLGEVAQGWIENGTALKKALQKALVPIGNVEAAPVLPLLKHDKPKDGCTLLEDVPFDGQPFVPDIVEFLRGEYSVSDDTMRQRAKELNAHLGQRHAEYLLEHQDLIPKEWRGKYYLVFPGTVWQYSRGSRSVPCLYWLGLWRLGWLWLGDVWYSYGRLVRPRG